MKIPRDLTANDVIKMLSKLGYVVTRQKGSHIRLTSKLNDVEHHITIPDHSPIKLGTINNVLKDVAEKNKLTKEKLIELL
jgi:predicted RNA binding protein YcfA (HicA-like mRNA interferase family)